MTLSKTHCQSLAKAVLPQNAFLAHIHQNEKTAAFARLPQPDSRTGCCGRRCTRFGALLKGQRRRLPEVDFSTPGHLSQAYIRLARASQPDNIDVEWIELDAAAHPPGSLA